MKEQKQFLTNLTCLRRIQPELYDMLQKNPMDGQTVCRTLNPVHFDNLDKAIQSGGEYFYFAGLGDGSLLAQYADRITSANRGIMAIEPSVSVFRAILHNHDMEPLFRNRKISWIIGDDAKEKADAVFEESLCYAAAKPYFFLMPSLESPAYQNELEEYLQWLRNQVTRRKIAILDRLKNLPERLKNAHSRSRRIWSFDDYRGKARFTTIQSVLMRNLFYGLRKLGYEIEYLTLRDGYYYPPYYRILKMALFEPGLIFLCNLGAAYDMALGGDLSRSLPVPKVTWFADNPVYAEHLILRHKTSSDETYLMADYEWGEPLVENGAKAPLFMPGAATRTRRGKKRGSRKCDVVFVGQIRDQRSFFAALSPAWRAYCEQVILEKLRFPRKKIRDVMNQFPIPGPLEPDRMDELRQKVLWEANTRFRLNVVRSLADCDLRVYGNDAWLNLLPSSLGSKCFRGVLRFKHLFEVYRNARISLNIHSLQSYTCLNVRDFDVPVSGGFLLSDWLPRADEIFNPGFVEHLPECGESKKDVFFYRTVPEMKKLIDYFLTHEEHRQACIERARERVLSAHTYAHRAAWLDELFQGLLTEPDSP